MKAGRGSSGLMSVDLLRDFDRPRPCGRRHSAGRAFRRPGIWRRRRAAPSSVAPVIVQAHAHEMRQRVLRRNQHLDVLLRGDRRVFAGHHGGIDDMRHQRLVAVEIAAEAGEFHAVLGNIEMIERAFGENVGKRARRRNRDGLALELIHRGDVVVDENAVRHHQPGAADDLDVGAVRSPRSAPARAALETVEIAGDQRLEQDLVVLDIGTISTSRPTFLKKPRCAAISRMPASLFGWISPCRHGLPIAPPPGRRQGDKRHARRARCQQMTPTTLFLVMRATSPRLLTFRRG